MASLIPTRLDSRSADFDRRLDELLERAPEQDSGLLATVAGVIDDVRKRGDDALIDLTNRYDRVSVASMAELEIGQQDCADAWERLPDVLKTALQASADRIRAYAERQRIPEWETSDELGNRLGVRVTPMDRVGVYVPGGKAAYPSSVLMNVIPARVAGVREVIMVTPTPGGTRNPVVLAAAHLVGVDRVIGIGGAQAVAALAWGTESLPRVDKIVGPGNAYVAAAKRIVYGYVGIDSIAGPSEIVVIADARMSPDWAAMDLFSQAEHGEDSQAVLISPDAGFLDATLAAMRRRLVDLPRAGIIEESLRQRGAMILVRDFAEAIEVANRIAPEHLELAMPDARQWLPLIRHAGAVFLGPYTPEALGDYCAGPNHVLPTSRAARFSNPLGVYEFQKRTSLIECTAEGARQLAEWSACIADAEGLSAHASSARDRLGAS